MIRSTDMDARGVVEAIIARWNTQDVETTMAYIAEDAEYALYVSEQTVPFAGVSRGRDEIRATLYMMLAEFDYLRFDREIVGVDGDVVKVQTQFKFHHRRTGGNLEGSMRTIFTVKGGMVVRCDEYLDQGLVDTFMRLTRQREAANEIVAPPRIPPARSAPDQATAPAEDQEPRE
jgi:ketosteroid isomerase-like protein